MVTAEVLLASYPMALAQARLEATRGITFNECAEKFVAAHAPSWKSHNPPNIVEKHTRHLLLSRIWRALCGGN